MLVADAAVFEFKAVARLLDQHRAQLLNYLLLTQLPHGKLINLRPETVAHEFVNTSLKYADRKHFQIDETRWNDGFDRALRVKQLFFEMLNHWGTSLSVSLYADALTHFLREDRDEVKTTDVVWKDRLVGQQPVNRVTSNSAFKVTGITDATQISRFENHLRRFLAASTLKCIHWINVTLRQIKLHSITNIES